MSQTTQSNGSILIADDDDTIRFLLKEFLEEENYAVIEAADGRHALDLFEQMHPDLVLLDAVMPTLDGFEVCRQLQALPGGKHTPVLMITGLEDQDSVDRAFEVGAVDYVTKPIHWPVLRQRVRRLLHTRQLEVMRDDLTYMIVHDMKNPLGVIKGYMELTLDDIHAVPGDEWLVERLSVVHRSSESLLDMAMMILDIGRMEEGKLTLQRTNRYVLKMLGEVKRSFDWMAKDRQIEIEIDCPDANLIANLDWSLMQRVLSNLVGNAMKHSPEETRVIISGCVTDEPRLILAVQDQGEGIATEDQPRIFEKFTQAAHRQRGSRGDTGLGLTFCKLATETHGGHISVESRLGNGAKFILKLPLNI